MTNLVVTHPDPNMLSLGHSQTNHWKKTLGGLGVQWTISSSAHSRDSHKFPSALGGVNVYVDTWIMARFMKSFACGYFV